MGRAVNLKPELALVRVGDLKVDPAYQRPLRPDWVKELRSAFDADGVGLPPVARDANGTVWLLDGQHRHATLLAIHGPDALVWVAAYDHLAPRRRSKMFLLFNQARLRMDPRHAGKVAGDIERVDEVVARETLAEYPVAVKSAAAPVQIVREGGQYGLRRVLYVLTWAWGEKENPDACPVAISRDMLLAAWKAIRADEALDERLALALADLSPAGLESLALAQIDRLSTSRTEALRRAMAALLERDERGMPAFPAKGDTAPDSPS